MKLNDFKNAYNMVEILVSLLILGALVGMSFQLLNPNRSDKMLGRKVDAYIGHLGSIHKRITSEYGVTPLNVDLDGDGCAAKEQTTFANGIPNFVRNFDSIASFKNGNVPGTKNGKATYLQYPSNLRVWLYPEEFTWMAPVIAEFEALGYSRREFMIIEAVPGGTMTGLPALTADNKVTNSDVILIHIDDQTGKVETISNLAIKHWGNAQKKYLRSFYDRYKDSIS